MSAPFLSKLQNMSPRSNRTLTDLINTTTPLSGHDALELRGWATQTPLIPTRDLQTTPLGTALFTACSTPSLAPLREYITTRLSLLANDHSALVKELLDSKFGPTRVGIYNVILPFLHVSPSPSLQRNVLLDITRYLAHDLRIPVDGTDVLGNSALYYAISTKPYAEPGFAGILFEAGASVNQRNRMGQTVGLEIAQVDFKGGVGGSVEMMGWWVGRGGDVDGRDGDGVSVRMVVEMLSKKVPGLKRVIEEGRGERREGCCENCGRGPGVDGGRFALCKRCKGVRYCGVECQKVDWKAHKKMCVAVS